MKTKRKKLTKKEREKIDQEEFLIRKKEEFSRRIGYQKRLEEKFGN